MKTTIYLVSCSALALYFTDPALAVQAAGQNAATMPAAEVPAPTQESDGAANRKTPDDAVATEGQTPDPMPAGEDARMAAIADLRKSQPESSADTAEDGTIEVTGSRLRDGDATSRLIVIDAQDIRDRGVTSVEELIRTLPQNVATIGAITNNRSKGPLREGNRPAVSQVGSLGVSAANLGGAGAGNTLVLVNGRRIAGAAGIEQGYANLNGIPLNAIERVEISVGGSSAVYGADALGGVINFILKRNYVGNSVTVQHETSSGGADNSRVSLYSGYGWKSGSISASVDFTARQPIVNRRTGYVTNNYAPRFGGNDQYDKRSFSAGLQPGVVTRPAVLDPDTGDVIVPETGLSVPRGFTGAPTLDDLIQLDLNSARDYIPVYAGPDSKSASATLTIEQNITDRLRISANGLYTRMRNTQQDTSLLGVDLQLAPGQYYNPFAAYGLTSFSPGITVRYFPESEIADGTLPSGTVRNLSVSWNANIGVTYDVSKSTKLELVYTRSSSRTTGNSRQLGSLVEGIVDDPNAPTGYSCINQQLDNNLIPANLRAPLKAAFDRQCLALTSTDPDIAFNPWKSTTNGGKSSIDQFFYVPFDSQDSLGSTLSNYEARLTGTAIELPGGKVNYAAGAEYVRNGVSSNYLQAAIGGDGRSSRYAFFGELTLPIVGRDFTLPLVKRLLFNIAARRDVSTSTGAIGTVDNVPLDQGGKLIFAENRFARTTPSFGVLWSPFHTVDVRAKFTQGFKAPPATQLFSVAGGFVHETTIENDPLYTCTTDCNIAPGVYSVPSRSAPNPDLRPETSRQQVYSIAWQPNGALSGLNFAVTYNRNHIRDQFATMQDLYALLKRSDILKLAQFYPRDATGRVTSELNMRFNVIGSTYESLTYEAGYLFDSSIGSFQPKVTVVQNITANQIGLTDAQSVSRLGRILGVDRYKVVGSLQWNKGPLNASVFVYHTPSYLNDYLTDFYAGVQSNPDLIARVAPLTTADLSISWVAAKGLSLQFTGRNILKARAPFALVDSLPYDTARYNVAGRTLALSAQLSF